MPVGVVLCCAGPAEVQQYISKLQAVLSESAPRLQAVFEKPGAQELISDVQWGLLQRFAARSIKFISGLQDSASGATSGTAAAPVKSTSSSGRIGVGASGASGSAARMQAQ